MKLLLEVLISIVLHPIAMVLAWLNIAGRSDLTLTKKLVWVIVVFVWGIGPILYLMVGDGTLW